MRSRTAETSRRIRPWTTLPSCRSTGSPPSAAGTTPWTATSAGTGRSGRSTRCSSALASLRRRSRGRRRAELRTRMTDEFIEPVVLEGVRRLEPGRRRDLLQLPAGPGAPALQRLLDARVRPDDDDALQRRPRLPGRLRGAGRRRHARRGAAERRAAPAARRRDGEVRARDLLLERRPRGRVARRDARARPVARATSARTTRSPRCRPPR